MPCLHHGESKCCDAENCTCTEGVSPFISGGRRTKMFPKSSLRVPCSETSRLARRADSRWLDGPTGCVGVVVETDMNAHFKPPLRFVKSGPQLVGQIIRFRSRTDHRSTVSVEVGFEVFPTD